MILYISITTLILALVITVFNYRINKTSLYLAGFLVPLSLTGILHYFSVFHPSPIGLAYVYGHFIPIYYLSGPMIFFYVRGTLIDKSSLSKWDYLHFLPALISLISIFPYYFESFDKKLAIAKMVFEMPNTHKSINISWLYPSSFNFFLRSVLVLIYLFCSLVIITQYRRNIRKRNVPSEQKELALKWLYALVFIASVASISYFIITKNYYFGNHSKDEINSYSINTLAALSYSLIPFMMLLFPQHLYGIPIHRKPLADNHDTVEKNYAHLSQENDASEDPFIHVANHVMNYLQNEKPFVNPDFCIDDLAIHLDIQKHHLYYCFNNILQTKFTALRTKLRVNYAQEILLSGDLTTMSMEGIWTKAGFSSRTNFFVSFKEVTGSTPLEFIKSQNLGDLMEN